MAGAPAVTGGADFSVRASFAPEPGTERPWEERLPAGTCSAWLGAPPKDPPSREALLADLEAFRGKEIWREADTLLRDTPRLRALLAEALGEEGVPEEEVLRRLPKDADFLGGLFRAAVERAALSPNASFAYAQKTYDQPGTRVEGVLAMRIDPLATLILAGLLDLGYALLVKYRYRIFGKHQSCPTPDPARRRKFLLD